LTLTSTSSSSLYTTTTTLTPTITQVPIALTTPFIFRGSTCLDILATTSSVVRFYWNSDPASSIVTLVYSDVSDPRFTSCQPPGWSTMLPESRFTFSPAVCPSGWTAHRVFTSLYSTTITTVSSTRFSYGTATTAQCCAR
jgi:hypothetical protein